MTDQRDPYKSQREARARAICSSLTGEQKAALTSDEKPNTDVNYLLSFAAAHLANKEYSDAGHSWNSPTDSNELYDAMAGMIRETKLAEPLPNPMVRDLTIDSLPGKRTVE